jgi:hypothetical protein
MSGIPERQDLLVWSNFFPLDSTWQERDKLSVVLNKIPKGNAIIDPISCQEYIPTYDYLQLLRFDGHEIVFFYQNGAIIEISNPLRKE